MNSSFDFALGIIKLIKQLKQVRKKYKLINHHPAFNGNGIRLASGAGIAQLISILTAIGDICPKIQQFEKSFVNTRKRNGNYVNSQ